MTIATSNGSDATPLQYTPPHSRYTPPDAPPTDYSLRWSPGHRCINATTGKTRFVNVVEVMFAMCRYPNVQDSSLACVFLNSHDNHSLGHSHHFCRSSASLTQVVIPIIGLHSAMFVSHVLFGLPRLLHLPLSLTSCASEPGLLVEWPYHWKFPLSCNS